MKSENSPPQAVLSSLLNGYWTSYTIMCAARLGVAEALGDQPETVQELAKRVHSNEDALYRILRAVASIGIFIESEGRRFAHTPLSQALPSLRGLAEMTVLLHSRAWPELMHSARTGETAFSKVFGKEIFDYLRDDQAAARAFDTAFTGYTMATAKAVAAVYDFSRFATVVDIGGSQGALLGEILVKNPKHRGINFDLPDVAPGARAYLAKLGLADRCEVVGGDFFAAVPEGGDAYTMKMILHDWDDAKSVAILKNIRRACKPHTALLVLEAVIPEGNTPSPGKFLDINMLVMTGGRERTEAEYRALFKAGGFELTGIQAAHPIVSVVEARAV